MRSAAGKLLMGKLHGPNIVAAHGTARERQLGCRRKPAATGVARRKVAGCFHSVGLGDVAPSLSRGPTRGSGMNAAARLWS